MPTRITEVQEKINKLHQNEIKNMDPSKNESIPDETKQLTENGTKRENDDSSSPPASEKKRRLFSDSVSYSEFPLPKKPSPSTLRPWKLIPISFNDSTVSSASVRKPRLNSDSLLSTDHPIPKNLSSFDLKPWKLIPKSVKYFNRFSYKVSFK